MDPRVTVRLLQGCASNQMESTLMHRAAIARHDRAAIAHLLRRKHMSGERG